MSIRQIVRKIEIDCEDDRCAEACSQITFIRSPVGLFVCKTFGRLACPTGGSYEDVIRHPDCIHAESGGFWHE